MTAWPVQGSMRAISRRRLPSWLGWLLLTTLGLTLGVAWMDAAQAPPPVAWPRGVAPAVAAGQATDLARGRAAIPAPAAARGPGTAPATRPASVVPAAALALPSRGADWPPVPAQALAAWQGDARSAVPARAASRAQPQKAGATAAAQTGGPAASAPATPFPYRWIGRLDDGSGEEILLAGPQRSVALRPGQVLDGRWRLERDADGRLWAGALNDGQRQPVPGAPVALRSDAP